MSHSNLFRSLTALALPFLMLHPARAQTPTPPLSIRALAVKTEVENLPVGGRVTVNMLQGEEYYGTIKSIEPESFSIHEADRKTDVTLRYEDVQRVRKDYGRKGFAGKRVHPHRNRIAGLIFIGALLGLVIGLVAADKS